MGFAYHPYTPVVAGLIIYGLFLPWQRRNTEGEGREVRFLLRKKEPVLEGTPWEPGEKSRTRR